jgi:hypothetical protein
VDFFGPREGDWAVGGFGGVWVVESGKWYRRCNCKSKESERRGSLDG